VLLDCAKAFIGDNNDRQTTIGKNNFINEQELNK
jgi:hypothetical protein